ncbi:MAG: Hsp20/alpha crystallin family protein [Vulcanimicrobiaceae bacterium]
MNNLSTVERAPVRSVVPRSAYDMLGWDPFRSLFGGWPGSTGIDVARTETGYTVEVPVSGYKPNEIDVTVEDGVLSIAGKSERRSFTRSLVLPEEIDADAIEATVEHGMLTLQLKLHPKAQPKKIAIKSHN